jgi:hypothetical protein
VWAIFSPRICKHRAEPSSTANCLMEHECRSSCHCQTWSVQKVRKIIWISVRSASQLAFAYNFKSSKLLTDQTFNSLHN